MFWWGRRRMYLGTHESLVDEIRLTRRALVRSRGRTRRRRTRQARKRLIHSTGEFTADKRRGSGVPRALSATSKRHKHTYSEDIWTRSRIAFLLSFGLGGWTGGMWLVAMFTQPYAHRVYWSAETAVGGAVCGALFAVIGWFAGKSKRYAIQSERKDKVDNRKENRDEAV